MIINRIAIIAGASGLVGSALTEILLKDDYYSEIIVLSRQSLDISDKRVINKVVDYGKIAEMLQGTHADDAYCCLGSTLKKAGSKENQFIIDHDYIVNYANECYSSGVKRFAVVSSVGANSKSSNFYLNMKGRMEEELKKCPFESLFILRPSLLLGKRNEFRFGEEVAKIFMKALNPFMSGKLKKYKGIEAYKVAQAMFNSCKNSQKGVFIIESEKIPDMS